MLKNQVGKNYKLMMTDPIADMLTQIRNAAAAKKPAIVLPYSKLKHAIADLLANESYVSKVSKVKNGNFDALKIELKYNPTGSAIRHIKRISTPGQRIYVNGKEMPNILNGFGIAIVSTSRGIMTNKEARKQNIGGELMCEIW